MNGLWEVCPHDTPCISFLAHCWGSLQLSIAAPVCKCCFPSSSPMDEPGCRTKDNIVREREWSAHLLAKHWQVSGNATPRALSALFIYFIQLICRPSHLEAILGFSYKRDQISDFSSLYWNNKLCQTGIPFDVCAHMYMHMFVCVYVYEMIQ